MVVRPPDEEALLPCGPHSMTLSDVRSLCVDVSKFSASSTRASIMDGLEIFAKRLVDAWIVGELWVDGSFLSKRVDPKDVDVVVRIGGGIFDEGLQAQKDALRWVIQNQKETLRCDSQILMEYWPSHPFFMQGELDHALYKSRFGFKDNGDYGEYKGFAVIRLPGGVK